MYCKVNLGVEVRWFGWILWAALDPFRAVCLDRVKRVALISKKAYLMPGWPPQGGPPLPFPFSRDSLPASASKVAILGAISGSTGSGPGTSHQGVGH